MRLGLGMVIALALGALAGHFLLRENGYVLISFQGYVIEMSVPVAVFLLAAAYLAVRLLVWIWGAPRRLGEATARARVRWAGRQATRGFIAIAEGRLTRGERLLTKGARRSGAPLMNYLAAARLAHMQNDPARRDGWLTLAFEQEPAAADAVLLTQAEMQMDDQAFEQALAALTRVREHNPRHGQALKLLGALHWRRQDWRALLELLPELRAAPLLPVEKLNRWTTDAFSALLAPGDLDETAIGQLWEQVPKALRREPELVRARVRALMRCGAAAVAETEIRRALRDEWDPELITLYGDLQLADRSQQLKSAEAFLRERPEDPDLLLTVGRLSFHNQLWGKARSYLETSLAVRPAAETYQALGRLMERVGDKDAATRAYQKGLELSTSQSTPARQIESKPAPAPELQQKAG